MCKRTGKNRDFSVFNARIEENWDFLLFGHLCKDFFAFLCLHSAKNFSIFQVNVEIKRFS